MLDCKQIIDSYIQWIKDNTFIRAIKDDKVCGIDTPFLDRHNDHLQIYIIKNDNSFKLTDDGYTIADLKMSGMELNTPKRTKIFKTILDGFGVKLGEHGEIYVDATPGNLGQKKHYLLQAILTVNDMYVLSEENVRSIFKEDVELYFKGNGIFYSKDIKLSGKSGFDHNIDFLINASMNKPERLIRTINYPKKDSITASIFAFNDIMQIRDVKMANYVIYNDVDNKDVSRDVLSALSNYGIKNIPWSQKELCKKEFILN